MSELKLNGPVVYISKIPESISVTKLASEERNLEILKTSNERAKIEKYYAFRVLERAICKELDGSIEDLQIHKNENGRWMGRGLDFSLSHSVNAVAVALSPEPIGVDIEAAIGKSYGGLAKKYLCADEYREYEALSAEERELYFLSKWTAKEALFKSLNEGKFVPSRVNPKSSDTVCHVMNIDGEKYVLSVASKNKAIKLKTV